MTDPEEEKEEKEEEKAEEKAEEEEFELELPEKEEEEEEEEIPEEEIQWWEEEEEEEIPEEERVEPFIVPREYHVLSEEEIEKTVEETPEEFKEMAKKRLEELREMQLKYLYMFSVMRGAYSAWIREAEEKPIFRWTEPYFTFERFYELWGDRIRDSKISCKKIGETWKDPSFKEETDPKCEGNWCEIVYPDGEKGYFNWYNCYGERIFKEKKIEEKESYIYPAESIKCFISLLNKHKECFKSTPKIEEQAIYLAMCSPSGEVNFADIYFTVKPFAIKGKKPTVGTIRQSISGKLLAKGKMVKVSGRRGGAKLVQFRPNVEFKRPTNFVFPEKKVEIEEETIPELELTLRKYKRKEEEPLYKKVNCKDLTSMHKILPKPIKVLLPEPARTIEEKRKQLEKQLEELLKEAPPTVRLIMKRRFPISSVDFTGEEKERSPENWLKLFEEQMKVWRERRIRKEKKWEKKKKEMVDTVKYIRDFLEKMGLPPKLTYKIPEKLRRKGITVIEEGELPEKWYWQKGV